MAATRPDLIIGFANDATELGDTLAAIAPTLLVVSDRSDWRADAETLAKGVRRERELTKTLQAFDNWIASLAGELDSFTGDVSIVRVMPDAVRVHTRFHFSGQIVDELGLARPRSQQTDDPTERRIDLSLEEISQPDADGMFLFGAGDTGLGSSEADIKAPIGRLASAPIWRRLSAVPANAVHVVHPLAWQQGGMRAADPVLDDIADALT